MSPEEFPGPAKSEFLLVFLFCFVLEHVLAVAFWQLDKMNLPRGVFVFVDFMSPEEFPEPLKRQLQEQQLREEQERRQRELDKSTCKVH